MREQLKILIVFNSEDYIKLVLREIKKSGYDIVWKKADSKEIFSEFLSNEQWDIIL